MRRRRLQRAFSALGFADVLADVLAYEMLVLIAGRTVDKPLFSGAFRKADEVLLADVDRIAMSRPAAA